MKIYKVRVISEVFLMIILFGCTNDKDPKERSFTSNKLGIIKDTINVTDIRDEFRDRLYKTGDGVELFFFDKNKLPVGGLSKGDTFSIVVNYISDKFVDLVKHHTIELSRVKGDFTIISRGENNRFTMAIGSKADTIELEVDLKSDRYIFNEYYFDNKEIKYRLTNKIGLCRLTELPK